MDMDWKRSPLLLPYLAHQRPRGVNEGDQGRQEERLFSSLCERVLLQCNPPLQQGRNAFECGVTYAFEFFEPSAVHGQFEPRVPATNAR